MKTLEILLVTYNQAQAQLPCFVYALLSQTSQDYICRVLNDGISEDGTREFMESIIAKYPENFDYIESPTRANVHGHDNRAKGIVNATSPLLTLSNADNYICPLAVEAIIKVFQKDPSIQVTTFPILHSYFNYSWFEGSEFATCRTDMCQFALTREVAQAVPFRPGMAPGQTHTEWRKQDDFSADGWWIELLKKRFPNLKIVHLPMGLAVHN